MVLTDEHTCTKSASTTSRTEEKKGMTKRSRLIGRAFCLLCDISRPLKSVWIDIMSSSWSEDNTRVNTLEEFETVRGRNELGALVEINLNGMDHHSGVGFVMVSSVSSLSYFYY